MSPNIADGYLLKHPRQGGVCDKLWCAFDVFRLSSKGLTAHKIVDELCLGYKTVANYVTQIKKKLQVSSIAGLAHIAILLGIMNH